ncbi:hypothetical protein ACN47E_005547 [Coniothyrium glycines]
MKYTFTTLALAALSTALPQASPAPPSFKIKNVISGGSGCPQGSIDIDWTDNKILPIYFTKDFTARVGRTADIVDSRKNCQINLSLSFSPGYSFAVYSADYAGYADLDAGVTGTVQSTYYFSGYTDQVSAALTIPGPYKGKYNKSDDVAISVWSPCEGSAALNVNSEVALTPLAGAGSGVLTSTKETGKFGTNVYIKWKQC